MLTVAQEILINQFAQQIVDKIAIAIKSKNINRTSVRYEKGERITRDFSAPANASGKLVRSLSYEITETSIIIKGEDYAYYLVHGRKPTKNEGTGSVKSDILQWIKDKGIIAEGISEETLAFLIARKIHREGSSIYIKNKGENSGLLTNIVNDATINDFNSKFTAQLIKELKTDFGF